MNFFEEWERNLENTKYIHAFLAEKDYTKEVLETGLACEVEQACSVLQKVSLERFIECICRFRPKKKFDKSEVPIFSNFEMGAVRTPELLAFTEAGMTFDALGYQLNHCQGLVAQKKYGENQGKLAALLGVASVTERKPRLVRATALGNYLNTVSAEEKSAIWKRMLLRNAYMQHIIASIAKGPLKYKDTVSCLAESNIIRRRGNVRALIELILKGSKKECLLQHIDWRV